MQSRAAWLAVLFCATLIACNGGSRGSGAMSLDDYFTELDQIFAEADEQGAAIADPFASNQDATLDERKDAASDAFASLDRVIGDVMDGLEELEPPSEVERLHGLLIIAATGYRGAIASYTQRIEAAGSDEAFDAAAIDGGTFEDAIVALEDICIDLQDAAGEYEITVDLECGP